MYYKLVNDSSHIVFDSFDKAFKKGDETSIKLHSLTPDQIVGLMDMHANGALNLIDPESPMVRAMNSSVSQFSHISENTALSIRMRVFPMRRPALSSSSF